MIRKTQETPVLSIIEKLGKGALGTKLHGVLECWIIGIMSIKS